MYSCTPQNAKIGYTLLNRICNTLKLLVSVAYTRAYESVMMVQASMKPFSSHRISACVSFFILIFLLSFFASTHARSLPQIWRSIEEAFYFLPKICKDSDDALDQGISYYVIILLEFCVSISSYGSYHLSFPQVNNGSFLFDWDERWNKKDISVISYTGCNG